MKLKSLKVERGIYYYLFSILFFSSCYLIPCNLDSGLDELNIKQEDDFFIGEYVVERVINNSYNFKINKSSIKIKKNGILEMNNVSIQLFDLRPDKEINVNGTWKSVYLKEKSDDRYFLSLSLKFDEKDNIEDYVTSWKMYIKRDKPVILIKIGDPDNCSAIRFIKE